MAFKNIPLHSVTVLEKRNSKGESLKAKVNAVLKNTPLCKPGAKNRWKERRATRPERWAGGRPSRNSSPEEVT